MSDYQVNVDSNVLYIKGDLSFATVMPVLKESAHLFRQHTVTQIDLSQLDYMDSSGLALLCQWKRDYPDTAFVRIPEQFNDIIAVSGLTALLSAH